MGWEGAGRTALLKADLLEEVVVGGMPREGSVDMRSEAHFPGNRFLLPVSAVFTLGGLHWVLFQARSLPVV